MKLFSLVLSAVNGDTLVTITDKVENFELSRYNFDNGDIQANHYRTSNDIGYVTKWCSAIVNSELYVINTNPTVYKFNGCTFEYVANLPPPFGSGDALCGMYNDNGTQKMLICIEQVCKLWDPIGSGGVIWDNLEDFASPGRVHDGGQLIMDGVGGNPTIIGGADANGVFTDFHHIEIYEASLNAWIDETPMLQTHNLESDAKNFFIDVVLNGQTDDNGRWMLAKTANSNGDGSSLWIQAHTFDIEAAEHTLTSYHWGMDVDGVSHFTSTPGLPHMREDKVLHPFKFYPMQFAVASNEKMVVYHREHNCQGENEPKFSTLYKIYEDNLGDDNPYDSAYFNACVNQNTSPYVSVSEIEAYYYDAPLWKGPFMYFGPPKETPPAQRYFKMSFWESELDIELPQKCFANCAGDNPCTSAETCKSTYENSEEVKFCCPAGAHKTEDCVNAEGRLIFDKDNAGPEMEQLGTTHAGNFPERMMDGDLNTMWVTSDKTVTEDKGVVLTFNETVQIHEMHVWPRGDCCVDRFANVCLYVDDDQIACSPSDYMVAPTRPRNPINFIAEFVRPTGTVAQGKVFELMFEEDKAIGIAEFELSYFLAKGPKDDKCDPANLPEGVVIVDEGKGKNADGTWGADGYMSASCSDGFVDSMNKPKVKHTCKCNADGCMFVPAKAEWKCIDQSICPLPFWGGNKFSYVKFVEDEWSMLKARFKPDPDFETTKFWKTADWTAVVVCNQDLRKDDGSADGVMALEMYPRSHSADGRAWTLVNRPGFYITKRDKGSYYKIMIDSPQEKFPWTVGKTGQKTCWIGVLHGHWPNLAECLGENYANNGLRCSSCW